MERVLLKLSGESFANEDSGFGVDSSIIENIAKEISEALNENIQIAIVVGGGNFFRGVQESAKNMEQANADYMGMLATVINSVALKDSLDRIGVQTRVQSAIEMTSIAEPYIRLRAIRHLEKGRVVIFAGGTGNPYFTTDTAASLRAMEIGADVIFKATKVDGIYSSDPRKNKDATRYEALSYLEVLKKGLRVMDSTSVSLCMDNQLPMVIFNFRQTHSIKKVLLGEKIGTTVAG